MKVWWTPLIVTKYHQMILLYLTWADPNARVYFQVHSEATTLEFQKLPLKYSNFIAALY